MSDKSLYETLGISPDADEATIKKAYLKLARETHPDKHPGDETAQWVGGGVSSVCTETYQT